VYNFGSYITRIFLIYAGHLVMQEQLNLRIYNRLFMYLEWGRQGMPTEFW